jgi:isopenicillin N synthase-like dioxygenase
MERSKFLPSQVLDNSLLFERFVLTAHQMGLNILTALSNSLELTGCDRFEHKNRMTEPSKSAMEYLKYAKQSQLDANIGHKAHTDLGCLSLLFHAEAGLQIRLKESSPWEHVQTRPGVAIVNVGDTLQYMSDGRLRSVLHRVAPLAQHTFQERFTVGYFMRAENAMSFVGRESETTTAGDWHDEKLKAYDPKGERST